MTDTVVSSPIEHDRPSVLNDQRERISVCATLVGAALLYLWNLSANGWANEFYAAAVQAGTVSWKAFLFGSSDAANSITVDKPPLFLWPMELSGRVFGVNSWSMLVPQVLIGVGTVALLWWTVRRYAGPAAGLIAAVALTLTPIFMAMSRYNNPEPMMLLLMVASVWATLEAVRDGRLRWMVLAGVFVGLSFLTKQLEALVVVPALGLTYLLFGPPRLLMRLGQLAAAGVAAVLSAGWWVAVVQLWPPSSRPWIGGSPSNSFLELTFGYNGLDRLSGKNNTGGPSPAAMKESPLASPRGLGRMLHEIVGGQISWLLPSALVLTIVGLVLLRRVPRTDGRRACLAAFGTWLFVVWLLFNFMHGKGGMFSPYYSVALAPAIAATVGMGAVLLWEKRNERWAQVLSATLILGTASWAWVLLGREPGFVPWLRWAIVAAAIASAFAVLRRSHAAIGLAALAALAGPLAFCVDTDGHGLHGGLPLAGPDGANRDLYQRIHSGWKKADEHKESRATPAVAAILKAAPKDDDPMDEDQPDPQVVSLLEQDADRYTWMAAAYRSNTAAKYQLATRRSVMPVGGFTGKDPAPTLEQFQDDVARHRIHFFVVEHLPNPTDAGEKPDEAVRVTDWVQRSFTPQGLSGVAVFDLTKPAPVPAELSDSVPVDH